MSDPGSPAFDVWASHLRALKVLRVSIVAWAIGLVGIELWLRRNGVADPVVYVLPVISSLFLAVPFGYPAMFANARVAESSSGGRAGATML